jgi:hypothetical protein
MKKIVFSLIILFLGLSFFVRENNAQKSNVNNDNVKFGTYLPEGIYVRMITLALHANKIHTKTGRWMLDGYTAQDILKVIEELKPDCLERFITGKQDPDLLVPVDEGEIPMTVVDFLNAAVRAGSEKCIIVPKLNLKWNEEYFFEAAQNLYDLPLEKPIRNINLDCWSDYCNVHTDTEIEYMLKRLKDIGFEVIGVNMTGGYHQGFGYVEYADFNIDTEAWKVNERVLNKLKNDPYLKKYFLYIDYPGAMNKFRSNNTADEQASVYINNIYPNQWKLGFTFVYPIFQDDWDATKLFTSPEGPYKGKSIYEIFKGLIQKTRDSSK